MTLKIQGQGHICGHRSNDKFGVGFVSIGPPVSIGPTVLELRFFKTLSLKTWGQGHAGGQGSWPIIMSHLQLVSSQSYRRFWNSGHLKLWPRNFEIKVMPEVKGTDLHLCRLTKQFIWHWFCLDRADGSWVMGV